MRRGDIQASDKSARVIRSCAEKEAREKRASRTCGQRSEEKKKKNIDTLRERHTSYALSNTERETSTRSFAVAVSLDISSDSFESSLSSYHVRGMNLLEISVTQQVDEAKRSRG